MLRILVSNDDGIDAFGIRTLVRFLSNMAEVYVVAPEAQRSASGQAISLGGAVYASEREMEGAKRAVALSGTPADCVKFGIDMLRREGINPDFVIGGINHGGNAGIDINYSGTFAVANEGALNGYRAIALSVTSRQATHFEYICELLPELIEVSQALPIGTILNVNSPDMPKWQIKGVRYTDAGGCGFEDSFVRVDDDKADKEGFGGCDDIKSVETEDNGKDDGKLDGVYRYSGEIADYSDKPGETDLHYLAKGYATITPYRANRIDRGMLSKLNGLTSDKALCIIMDMQEHRIPFMRKSDRFMTNVLKLARCLNVMGLPTLLTEQYSYESAHISGRLKNELRSFEKLDKVDFDCTGGKDMEEILEAHQDRHIVLAGLEAHISILQSAKSLLNKGYEVTVIKDCCASRQKEDYEAAMISLANEGCNVTTLEAFVYEQLGSTADFSYRQIKSILDVEE